MKELIGIVGGMGSHATVSLFRQLINTSPATKDQEYMEMLIHNNTRIPDRTEGIVHHGEDPLPELLRSVKLLESCGATTIILACITAHYYSDQLERSLSKAKLFHMIRETADYTCSMYPYLKKVGVLATEGTLKSGLWNREFDKRQINAIVLPDRYQRDCFDNVIYGAQGIKAGYQDDRLKKRLLEGCEKLYDMGAEAIIGACSELPLMISKADLHLPYIDSIQVAVEKLIDRYHNKSNIR